MAPSPPSPASARGEVIRPLDLGECFAYACAGSGGVPPFFAGDDFRQADIPSAMA